MMLSQVAGSTQPFNGQRFRVVLMVLLGKRCRARLAGQWHELSAALVHIRVTSAIALQSLFRREWMSSSPFTHVFCMALKTISAPHSVRRATLAHRVPSVVVER